MAWYVVSLEFYHIQLIHYWKGTESVFESHQYARQTLHNVSGQEEYLSGAMQVIWGDGEMGKTYTMQMSSCIMTLQ